MEPEENQKKSPRRSWAGNIWKMSDKIKPAVVKKITIILGVISLLLCLFFLGSFYFKPRLTAQEDVWQRVVKAYRSADAASADQITTDTGKKVAAWLFSQSWIKYKLKPKILCRIDSGTRFEIREQNTEPDGVETFRLIFVRQNGAWKFEDVYLETMKDYTYEMYLSEFINNPHMAELKLMVKNPGQAVLAPFSSAYNFLTGWVHKIYSLIELAIGLGLGFLSVIILLLSLILIKLARRN
jgi:hypothetical protein